MHPIDLVNVGTARFAPHALNSRCPATAEGVARRVVRPEVGFDLGQAHCHSTLAAFSDDDLSKKLFGNLGGRTLVECPAKRQVGMAHVG